MTKDQLQIEELSQAIDAMNAKQSFCTTDDDLQQLMYTAGFVKAYGCTTEETLFISRLAEQISAEIATRRRRKRIASVVMGVAAAACLFAGVSFRTPLDSVRQHKQEVVHSPQVAIVEKSKLADPSANRRTMEEQPVSAQTSPPAAVRSVQPEVLPRRADAVSIPSIRSERNESEKLPTVAEATKPESVVLMILPDRVADSVVIEAGGIVRQVYGKNTDQELIITQRSQPVAEQVNTGSAVTPDPGTENKQIIMATATLNRATRKVNGIEIVVEGKQDQAELEKMANSLIPFPLVNQREGTGTK